VTDRERRLALNQTLFREVNERVAGAAHAQAGDEPFHYEFFCECSDSGCLERLRLTIGEYEAMRSNPTWFAIADGHEIPAIEQVVRRAPEYAVVQKLDEFGELVAERESAA
jgi:hypothetical protein